MALAGVLAPAVTPFDEQLEPDVPRWIRHCRWLLANGCSGLAIFGTTSEANSLSVDERARLLDALIADGIDPARLVPGTGCCALPDSVRLTRLAVRAGCAGVLMLPPFYYKNLSEEGIYRSFATVIDRVADPRLRVYLYHIPQVSQVGISLRLIERLLRAYPGVVVGMKDSSGDWSNSKAVLDAFDKFEVFVGTEKLLLANLREGGVGCITAGANVNAAAIDRLYREWRSPHAEHLQAEIDAVRALLEGRPLIAALKATLAHFTGHQGWRRLRPPLVELAEREGQELVNALSARGFKLPI
jgi:4-hydroxy-tetrahydrodipicolinate synthase